MVTANFILVYKCFPLLSSLLLGRISVTESKDSEEVLRVQVQDPSVKFILPGLSHSVEQRWSQLSRGHLAVTAAPSPGLADGFLQQERADVKEKDDEDTLGNV